MTSFAEVTMMLRALVLLVLLPGSALALGVCEQLADESYVYMVSDDKVQVAVKRVLGRCIKEEEVTFNYTAIVDAKGKAVAFFPDEADEATTKRYRTQLGKLVRPHAELEAYLRDGKFQAPTPVATPTKNGCTGSPERKAVTDPDMRLDAYKLWVNVDRDGKSLKRFAIGRGEEYKDSPSHKLDAFWFASAGGLVVGYTESDSQGFQGMDTTEDGKLVEPETLTVYTYPKFRIIRDKALAGCF